jgi:hypothetical protein
MHSDAADEFNIFDFTSVGRTVSFSAEIAISHEATMSKKGDRLRDKAGWIADQRRRYPGRGVPPISVELAATAESTMARDLGNRAAAKQLVL